VSAKSNKITIDLSDIRKDNSVSIPTINWMVPVDSISYLENGKFNMVAEVKSIYGLNSVKLRLMDRKNRTVLKEFKLNIEENSRNYLRIDRGFTLPNGEIEIEIEAENMDGFSSRVTRIARVTLLSGPVKKD
jgi:antitoxin component YwqK of YwqJK toxin-antitoxin module